MGAKVRALRGFGLEEGVSSRLLVYVGQLMRQGLDPIEACTSAIVQTLTDDDEVVASMLHIVQLYFGDLLEMPDVDSEPSSG
jgi:nitric oxide reductase NorQ protein